MANKLTEQLINHNTTTIHDYLYDYGTDNAGNLNTKKDGTTTLMTYSYDALNRTSSIVNGSTTTSFKYNAANQRLSKTTGTITTNSIWENGQIAFDYVNNNGTYSKQQYLQSYGQDGTVTNGTIMANTLDGKNNVVGSLAPGINMRIYNSQFDAYGNNKLSQNTSTPFGYDGYYTDSETGLCYLNARYYDPASQQFTQEDTYQGDINDPMSLNLYNYCGSNPVMYTDPSGHFAVQNIGSIVNGLTNLAGFAWDKNQGIWYSLQNCWQRQFGYCEEYNTAAPFTGIFIQNKPINFNYGGKLWRIWLWKGLYGVTTGAEIGIYIYSGPVTLSYKGLSYTIKKWYRSAYDSESLSMSFTLYKNGKKLFSRSDHTWWLTGFMPGISFWWDKLRMDISIIFPNGDMKKAFCKALGKAAPSSNTVSFSW